MLGQKNSICYYKNLHVQISYCILSHLQLSALIHQLDEEISRPSPEKLHSPLRNSGFASPKDSPSPEKTTYHPPKAIHKTQEQIDAENIAQFEQTRGLERKRTSEMSEAKKRLSALVNKRSVMISARFSGPMQDERLREVSKRQVKVDSECLRVMSLISKEAKKHPPGGGQVSEVGCKGCAMLYCVVCDVTAVMSHGVKAVM
jgi:hypothetical protein